MLRALGQPLSFVVLVASFVLAVTLHGWLQSLLAARTGDGRLRVEGRLAPDPRRHLDPFGAVAGAIAGMGWSRPLDGVVRRGRGALLAVYVLPSLANLLVGLAGLAVVGRVLGLPLAGISATLLQQGLPRGAVGVGTLVLLLFATMNLYVGALSLVPLPPLDGGRLLFALAPRTAGWQRAEYQLADQNIGLVAVLVLLLIPLGGPQALLPAVLDDVLAPLVRAVTGG